MTERGPARLPPPVRRQQLLDAARSVIAERGLHATTVRDVAAAGGVAVGTVTYHFDGMAEVLAGVLQGEMASYSAAVFARARAAPTGRDGVQLLVFGLLASGHRAHAHWKLWLDFWALAAHYPHYAQWQAQVYRDLHELTEDLLDRGIADGSIGLAHSAQAAVELIALLDGVVVQAYLPDSRLSPRQAREMMGRYLSRTLGEEPV